MVSAKVYTKDGGESGTIELNESVFAAAPNETLVHEVALALQNAKRQGNAETKTRDEVSGGGKKPFRQKGTGNARQGSSREPKMRGGGRVFGPHKRGYRQHVPVKMRRKALCCVLSERLRADHLRVLDSLDITDTKTKPMAQLVKHVAAQGKKTLVVTAEINRHAVKSAQNIPGVVVQVASDINTLDVLQASYVVVEKAAVAKLQERLG
ncbi:MAG: 50S ribosomal protein L4 [Candidatus Hydrogenedentota bacterium]